MRPQQKQKYNSPTFAYVTVFGKEPDYWLRGRTSAPKKTWRGLEIDLHLKDSWLEDLNSIPEIEIRASDEGKKGDKDRVAFIVFRFRDLKNDTKAEAISQELAKIEGIYSKSDIGFEDRPRIVVAGDVRYGDENWEGWWDSLTAKIRCTLEKLAVLGSPQEQGIRIGGLGYVLIGIVGLGIGYVIYRLVKKKK